MVCLKLKSSLCSVCAIVRVLVFPHNPQCDVSIPVSVGKYGGYSMNCQVTWFTKPISGTNCGRHRLSRLSTLHSGLHTIQRPLGTSLHHHYLNAGTTLWRPQPASNSETLLGLLWHLYLIRLGWTQCIAKICISSVARTTRICCDTPPTLVPNRHRTIPVFGCCHLAGKVVCQGTTQNAVSSPKRDRAPGNQRITNDDTIVDQMISAKSAPNPACR